MNMPYAFFDRAPALNIVGLRHAYAAGHDLQVSHLEVSPGEIFALVGLNGAGKSTLLRCVLDLRAIDTGCVELFGISHRNPVARAKIAFLPDRFMPLFYLCARDLIRYMLALHGENYRESEAKQMCQELDLDPGVLGRQARELSKGMTQKLGLAACLLSRRSLLLLDEPASGLDIRGRNALARQLRTQRMAGHTVVLSSHHLVDVAAIADRIGIIHAGRMRFVGTPQELLACFGSDIVEEAFLRCIGAAD
jgi:ABC-2 type transport system ATP-binding protein